MRRLFLNAAIRPTAYRLQPTACFLIAAVLCVGGCESAAPKPTPSAEEALLKEYLAAVKEAGQALGRANRSTFLSVRRQIVGINDRLRAIDHRIDSMSEEELWRLREAAGTRRVRIFLRNAGVAKKLDDTAKRLAEQQLPQEEIDDFFKSREVRGLSLRNQRILARLEDKPITPENELPLEIRDVLHGQSTLAENKETREISSTPQDKGALSLRYQEGKEAMRRRDYDRAIVCFSDVLKQYPKSAAAYVQRGDAYLHQKDTARAIADFTAAIELEPDNAEHYQVRGQAYSAMGEWAWDKAIADYIEAARLDARYAVLLSEAQRQMAEPTVGDQQKQKEQMVQAFLVAQQDLILILRSTRGPISYEAAFPHLKEAYALVDELNAILTPTLKLSRPDKEPWLTKYLVEIKTLEERRRREEARIAALPQVGERFVQDVLQQRKQKR